MDYKYIEQLLSRYFEADTSLKEEQILRTFFAQDDEELPADLRRFKSLFSALEPRDVLSDDFDDRMLGLVGHDTEADAPASGTEQPETVKARVIRLPERLRPLLRAAAVVAVFLTLSTAINQSFRDDNVWTDEEQIAHYQDELRKAALAAASNDSTLLFSEDIGVKADTLMADTLFQIKTGYIE